MTAVLDVVDCPQCSWRSFYEFETRRMTSTTFCPRCGYRETTRPLKTRKTKSGDLVYRTTKRCGVGAHMIKRRSGVSEIGALERLPTRRTIAQFKQGLKHPEIDAGQSFLTRWDAKRKRVETVVGKFPRTLP